MREDWKIYKLGEIATLQRGFDLPSSKRIAGNIPIIAASGIGGYHNMSKVKGPGVVTGRSGTIGKVMFEKGDFWPLNTSLWVKDFHGNDSKFIYYLLTNFDFSSFNNGTSVPTLNRNDVHSVDFSIPELQEQKQIASILSALDDKIELNLQMNKTLEEMAMALYKHWFVDFGPFQKGKFVDSELGLIPEGWEVKSLGELFKVKHGYAFKGIYFQLEERKELLLTPGNFMKDGGIKFNWGKQKFYSGEVPRDYILKRGDLLIALTDLTQSCDILGAPAFIPDEDFEYLHNQRLGLVTDFKPLFPKELIYLLANTVHFRSYIKNTKTGSTVSHTSPSRLYEYKVALPTTRISDDLNNQFCEFNNLKFSNLSENKLLTKLRDTLLPKLISGEVRVREAKEMLSQALSK